jgi:signal peptidase I
MDMNENIAKEIKEWIKSFIIALAAVLVIKYALFDIVPILNVSMQPTIYEDDMVFLDIISYKLHKPAHGDVIIFRPPADDGSYYIKRAIALPGDRIVISGGRVYINGTLLEEDYLPEGIYTSGDVDMTIGKDMIYVLGDNRGDSEDSRAFGPIPIKSIRGHALFTLYPLARIKKL